MQNPFQFSQDNKRYHTYAYALRQRYGIRVARVPLDGGFTCPNRDGTKGVGGCTFCSGSGSGDQIEAGDLRAQYDRYREKLAGKWQNAKCMPYFQSFSGTYAPVEQLQALYEGALALPDAVGLVIATRGDCVTAENAALLGALARRTDVTVELGLQTASDETALRIGRAETRTEFMQGLHLLRAHGVPVWVHLMNGLPGEDRLSMLDSARFVAGLDVQGVKLHALHVLRGTPLADMWCAGQLSVLSMEDYVGVVCDQLEVLPPEFIIGRLTGDGAADALLAPDWSRRKRAVLAAIDKELVRRDSWQGKFALRGQACTSENG